MGSQHQVQKQFIDCEPYINGTHTYCAIKYSTVQNYWLHKWILWRQVCWNTNLQKFMCIRSVNECLKVVYIQPNIWPWLKRKWPWIATSRWNYLGHFWLTIEKIKFEPCKHSNKLCYVNLKLSLHSNVSCNANIKLCTPFRHQAEI